MLQEHYESYMIFCLVYDKAQNHLLATAEYPAMAKIILRNAVVLFQCLRCIENREMFSPNDVVTDENNISGLNNNLVFKGYGMDDFMSKEKRRLPIFDWFGNTFKGEDSNEYYLNVKILSRLMNEQYNQLKEKFPSLSIERHQVSIQPKTELKHLLLLTNILTPLYHFSD
jgi:hypothetical protein